MSKDQIGLFADHEVNTYSQGGLSPYSLRQPKRRRVLLVVDSGRRTVRSNRTNGDERIASERGLVYCAVVRIHAHRLRSFRPCRWQFVSDRIIRAETVSDYGADGSATAIAAYDLFGREVARTDVLGNTVTTEYDGLGRVVSTSGGAYPIRTGYDSTGRKTFGLTTRDDDANWDATEWSYRLRGQSLRGGDSPRRFVRARNAIRKRSGRPTAASPAPDAKDGGLK